MTDLNTLLHIPVKECGDYCTLDDILSSGENSHGDHMNILVAIRKVCVILGLGDNQYTVLVKRCQYQ